MVGRISWQYSVTAFTLPGSVYINVLPETPAIPRLNNAAGFSVPYLTRISSIIPGISFSSKGLIVSGVKSLGPMPVPPVVKIASAPEEIASVISFVS